VWKEWKIVHVYRNIKKSIRKGEKLGVRGMRRQRENERQSK
jgi:hypothetical protein